MRTISLKQPDILSFSGGEIGLKMSFGPRWPCFSALWWSEEPDPSCWSCTAGRASSTYQASWQCCGPTACGNACSRERVSLATLTGKLTELAWACASSFWHLAKLFYFIFFVPCVKQLATTARGSESEGGVLRSLISPQLCTTQCLKSNTNTHTLCFLDGWVGAESTVSAASVQALISQLVSCTFSRRPRVCQRAFVDPCLQGRSSRWSHWGAGDPSPNCQKDTGYVSSNSLLSGEVTIKKVAKGQT